MKALVFRIAPALAALLIVGCHTMPDPPSPPPGPAPAGSEPARQPTALDLQRAAHASPTGVLVVGGAIVRRCPTLRAMKAHPPNMHDDAAWLVILQSLADCLEKGGLKSERILVTGGDQTGPLVRYVLAKMGVDRERVDVARSEEDDDCDLDDCSYFSVRVDLARASGTQASR
jgi:hypothetical protein